MKKPLFDRSSALRLGIAFLSVAGGLSTLAADRNWTGGSSSSANWSDAANWDVLPANGDNLIFNSTTQAASTDDLLTSIGWLQFGTGNFTLSGTSALNVSRGITNSMGDNTFSLPLALGASQTWDLASGSSLTFSSGINLDTNSLALSGDGNTTISTTAVSGSGSLTKNGAGTLTLSVGSTYSGGTVVNGGNLVSTAGGWYAARGIGTGLLTINPGALAEFQGSHAFGADPSGRAVVINDGTLRLSAENYFSSITMSNGVIDGGGQVRNGNPTTFTILAGTAPSSIQNDFTVSYNSADAIFNISNNAQLAISGTVSGDAAGIQKNGPGLLQFDGACTYSKPTLVNAGTLKLGYIGSLEKSSVRLGTNTVFDVAYVSYSIPTNASLSGYGSVVGTLNDNNTGGSLTPGANMAAGTLSIESLNLNGGLTINFDLGSTTTLGASDLLMVTNLTLSSGATNLVNFSFLGGTPALGSYTLIKFINGPPAGPVTTLTATASRYSYSFTSDGTAIKVSVTGAPAPLVWKGDGVGNVWDVGTTTNWMNGAAKDVFLQGDNATFTDVGSASPAINVGAAVQPTVFTVNATKDYTFAGSGKISNGAKLVKSNSGNLTLLTANDFTGGGSLNGSGAVNVGNGGSTGSLGTGNLTNNTKVNFFLAASTAYAGNMSGSGSVSSFMPGATLTLTGTNTFTGGLTVGNGTLQIGNNPTVAGASVTGNITNYGTLYFSRTDAFTNQNYITSAGNTLEYGPGDMSIRGAGGMTVDGTAPINLSGSLSIGQSMYGKLTVNPGGLINVGANLLLGNPNNAAYNGDLIQNGGVINVANQVRVGHWASEISTYTMNGGTLNVPNNNLAVGWDGIGLMTLNNGTVNCRTFNVDDNTATSAIGGTNSTFTMNGGLLNIGTGGIGGNTATVKLSGGTIAAAAPAGFSSGMAMILTNGSPTIDSSNATVTLSGVLSGNGGLTKQGAGYLNLNGANTFTGAVTVAQGTLQGSGTVAGPVTVLSGAALSAGTTLATGTLTLSNLTVNPGGGLTFDLSSTAATSDLLTVKGALTLDAATPVSFNFLGGTPYTGGPYTLITNWVSGRTGHLVYNTPATATRYAVTIDESNPNRIQASFSGANAGLVWKGNVNNLWNVNSDANWLNTGVADKYFQSDFVLFNDSGLSTPNVTLAGPMTPASVTVNAAGNYSFSGGDLSGAGYLVKSGAGTLTLSNNVTLTGGTTITGGTLKVGNGGTTGSLAGTVNNAGALVFNRADTVTFNGTINGPGTLTQAGPGTLLITATQNHTGGSTVTPGSTVQVGNGGLADAGSLGVGTVTNNGTVMFYRLGNVGVATPYTGSGALTFLGSGASAQSGYVLNATNTFTGPVTLSYARIQSGAGALSFGSPSGISVAPASQVYAAATPYSSLYNIPLTLAGTGWQDGLGALRIENGGTWAGPITLAANARIGVNNATTNTITGTISGNYELETYGGNAAASLVLAPATANSYNALRVSIGTAGATTVAGNANAIPNNIPLTMNGGILKLNGFDKSFSSFFNLSGSSSLQNGSAAAPATITLAPVLGASSYNGTFADGGSQPLNVTLTQTPGLWSLTLATANPNWTGNLTNNGGAIVTSGGSTYFGNNSAPNRFLVANNGGSFTWNINNVFGNGTANSFFPTIILNPGCSVSNNNYNVIGPVVLNGATLAGSRSGTTYRRYQFRGPVTVIGSAPSSIVGTGTGSGDHLDTTTLFNVADVTGNDNSDLIVTDLLADRSGDYGGSGALVKTGAGTLELDGANTYSGSTVISNGTVKLGPSASLASGNIVVGSGAKFDVSALSGGLTLGAQTLSGNGTVTGSLADGSGSVIQPGALLTAGTLTIAGNLTLNGTGSLKVDLATTTTVGGGVNGLLQVNGNLSLNDSTPTPVNFSFRSGRPATSGYYVVLKYTGTLSGSVAGLTNLQGYPVTFTVDTTAKEVRASFAAVPAQNLVWQGDGSANAWDLEKSSLTWFNGATDTNFNQLDTVRFDDSRTTANTTVNLTAEVSPAAITFDSALDYNVTGSGKLSGVTTITKNNTNTVTLGVLNEATGPININAGLLKCNGDVDGSYVGATTITVANGGAFDFSGSWDGVQRQPHTFVLAGAGPDGQGALRNSQYAVYSYTYISNVTLTANTVLGSEQRWDIGPMAGSTIDGRGFSLTKVGSGSLDLRAQFITNVASITISNGYMWYENYHQTNAWTATTTNYIKPGARLGNYGGLQIAMPIVLDGATIQNEGNGTPSWIGPMRLDSGSLFRNNSAQLFGGVISGPGAMWVDGGTAALTITNANTYAGGTIVSNAPYTLTNSSGTVGNAALLVANAAALGSGPLNLGLGAVTINTITNVMRPVEFNVTAGRVVSNDILLPTTLITNLALQGRDNTSVFTLAGKLTGGYASLTNWVDFGNAGSLGVMRLSNPANDFVARAINVNRGILAITADGVLGNSANVLRLDQANVSAGLRFDAPSVNVAHNILLQSASAFDLFGDNDGNGLPETVNNVTISGIVSGAASTVNLRGTNGVLTLTGANTYSGSWELVQPVVLQVASSANLGTAAVALKAGTLRYTGAGAETMTRSLWNDNAALVGATIDVTSPTASLTWNPASGTCNQSLTKTGAGAFTLGTLGISGGNFTVNAGTMTVNSVISGNSSVTVNGGTLVLNGANTYLFPTVVSAGTLVVNGSTPTASPVTIGLGGVLAGNGTLNGVVTLNAGATLQPGVNAIGKLVMNNSLNLAGTTVMEVNKAANTNDAIVGLTMVTYGGTLQVNNLGSQADLTNGTRFVLFSAASRYGSFAAFNLPALNSGLRWDTSMLAVDGSIQVVSESLPTTPTNLTYSVSGGSLNLAWPTNYTGWLLLEQTNNLSLGVSTNRGDWSPVPGAETTNQVSIPVDKSRRDSFYRLVRPPYNP